MSGGAGGNRRPVRAPSQTAPGAPMSSAAPAASAAAAAGPGAPRRGGRTAAADGGTETTLQSLDAVAAAIQTLRSKNHAIESCIQYIGTAKDNAQLRQRLMSSRHEAEELTRNITNAFKTTVRPKGPTELRHRKLLQEYETEMKRLRAAVQECIRVERKAEQSGTASLGSASSTGAPRKSGRAPTAKDPLLGSLDSAGDDVEQGGGRQQVQQQRLLARQQYDMTSVETQHDIERERLHELQQLETDFEELAELFEDMNSSVMHQGTMVQTVSDNIDLAVKDTNAGVIELDKARTYQKKSRKMMCCVICIVAIVAIVALATGLGFGLR